MSHFNNASKPLYTHIRKSQGLLGEHSQANDLEMVTKQFERHITGRPPGLRGKSIGFYYRDKMIKIRKRRSDTLRIKLKRSTIKRIRSLIRYPKFSDNKFYNSQPRKNDNTDLETKYSHITDNNFKRKFLNLINGNIQEKLEQDLLAESLLKRRENIDLELLDELNNKRSSSQYQTLLNFRKKLPAYEHRKKILDLIDANQVVLISGETGCGKTTQVAQLILDYEIECARGSIISILCTQPRRISTISVAERVAAERVEKLGNSVGYHIRLEKVLPRHQGSIVFCTAGMIMQFMQTDAALRNYSHIILDEIHERSIDSDFIMTLLKFIIPKRSDLKVILMSATLDSKQFSKYYNNCPSIHIPGFTYPIEEFYLEDILEITSFQFPRQKCLNENKKKRDFDHKNFIHSYYTSNSSSSKSYSSSIIKELCNPMSEDISFDLILDLTKYICFTKKPGAILIFLPGLVDITKLYRLFLSCDDFCHPDSYVIYALHSKMATVEQKQIFDVPPFGIRKIIISTAIAETSVTIEDVVYVIDCGKRKLTKFDIENNLQTLETEWESKANALQRKGRAGRVQPGSCYYLYTRARADKFEQYPLPEMLRTRLEEIILQIKILQIGNVDTFLATVIDPPDPKVISISLKLLRELKALDDKENLTPLGYHLAHLALDPRIGKIIILAAIFSCIDPVLAIAASLSFKDPFYCPLGKETETRQKKKILGLNQFSDHIVLCEALKCFERAGYRDKRFFCQEYFVSWNTLKLLSDMKNKFACYLYEMKFLLNKNPKHNAANKNSHNKSLIKSIVSAGFYPNIAIINYVSENGVKASTLEEESVCLHPSSINYNVSGTIYNFPSPYLTYFLKRKSSKIYLFDTTCVSPIALIFAAPSISVVCRQHYKLIKIPNNITFVCDDGAEIIQILHKKLDDILECKINNPGVITWNSYEGNILTAIVDLLSDSDEYLGL